MTKNLPPSEQGQLQGANSSILGIAGLFGPAVFTQVFATFIGKNAPIYQPGAPFLLAAVVLSLGLLLAIVVTKTPQTA